MVTRSSYLTAKIHERAEDECEGEEMDFITFHELVRPGENSALVAAQAFHHVLLLAAKNLVYVSQDEDYGTIQIGLQDIV